MLVDLVEKHALLRLWRRWEDNIEVDVKRVS